MIIIHGMFTIDPAKSAPAAKLLQAAATTSRGDEGNIDFRVAQELGAEGVFRVTEVWRDETALLAHTQNPHSADLVSGIGELGLVNVSVTRFTATDASAVPFPETELVE